MTNNSEHVDFATLSDFVDGVLDKHATVPIQEHLAVCQVCASEHDLLRNVLQSANDLPRSVLPQEDLWPELREALNSRKEVSLPTANQSPVSGSVSRNRLANSWIKHATLAAAAVVLVALSSGITAIVLRSNGNKVVINPPDVVPGPVTRSMLPVSFQQTESEYNRTIDELKLAVDTQRSTLSPETVRTVDHSLLVVDSAIAEARAALVADPNNRVLVDLLSASYQRKLDLLRRTSELGSRI